MHSNAWTETDRAVNLYKQNERFLTFFKDEEHKCANGVERMRVAKMLRDMINDFAGHQREDIGQVVDSLEAWGDED